MFSDIIIHGIPELINFFNQIRMSFYFSKPQIRHFQAFIIAMQINRFDGKLYTVSEFALNTCRTCIGRFLDSDAWNEDYLLREMQRYSIDKIWMKSKETGSPIYLIIDDTICKKTKPSSKAKQPIAGCGFHYSHLDKKQVYGQQFVTAMLRCGDLVLPFDTILYDKKEDSKIGIAKRIIESMPIPVDKGYVLADSWYSCETLYKTSISNGFHYIGGMKSNRNIYPRGFKKKGIQIGKFVHSLKLSDFDLVTINGEDYHAYTILGKIKGMNKVKVVITYPVGVAHNPSTLKIFVSTDIKMSTKQLLNHYSCRWPIELYFREANRRLGMKQCQAHSLKAVKRYQYIVMLCYTFCGLEIQGGSLGFSSQRSINEKSIEAAKLAWLYKQAQNSVPFDEILATYRLR